MHHLEQNYDTIICKQTHTAREITEMLRNKIKTQVDSGQHSWPNKDRNSYVPQVPLCDDYSMVILKA